jgi:HK97 family phage prohead protease
MSRIPNGVDLAGLQHAFRSEIRQEVDQDRRRAGLPSLAQAEADEIRVRAFKPEYGRSKRPSRDCIGTIIGYPVVFNVLSEPIGSDTRGKFREKIEPSAFNECLTDTTQIIVDVDHDAHQIVNTNHNANAVVIAPDRRGLQTAIELQDSEVGNYVLRALDDGRVKGMSFLFVDAKDSWADGVRTIHKARLTGLSILINKSPAYSQTLVKIAERAQRYIESGYTRRGMALGAVDSPWRE